MYAMFTWLFKDTDHQCNAERNAVKRSLSPNGQQCRYFFYVMIVKTNKVTSKLSYVKLLFIYHDILSIDISVTDSILPLSGGLLLYLPISHFVPCMHIISPTKSISCLYIAGSHWHPVKTWICIRWLGSYLPGEHADSSRFFVWQRLIVESREPIE